MESYAYLFACLLACLLALSEEKEVLDQLRRQGKSLNLKRVGRRGGWGGGGGGREEGGGVQNVKKIKNKSKLCKGIVQCSS